MNPLLGRVEVELDVDGLRPKYEGKTVLITGGAGSVGTACTKALLALGATPVVLDHSECAIARLLQKVDVQYELADVRFEDDVRNVFKQYDFDYVIHAAAYKHVPILENFRLAAHRNNVRGTRHVLQSARCPVTLISTDKAVEPSSFMGITKRQAEEEVAEAGQTAVRFGNVLGSSGSVLEIWEGQFSRHEHITITDPDMERYLMTMDEAAGLVLHAAGEGGVHVLRMGEPVTVSELCRRFLKSKCMSHYQTRIIGARPGEKKKEKLFADTERLIETDHPFIFKVER